MTQPIEPPRPRAAPEASPYRLPRVRGALAWVCAAVLAVAGCKARTGSVTPTAADRAPPYSFPDLWSPLNCLVVTADGLRGWAVGEDGAIERTTDGGQIWQRVVGVPVKVELHSVAFSSDGQLGCAVGDSGAVVRTQDGGQSWQKGLNVPTVSSLRSVALSADGKRGWALGADGVMLRSGDGAQTWQRAPGFRSFDLLESVAFAADGLHGWAVGDEGLALHTADGGQSWQRSTGVARAEYLQAVYFAADGVHGWTVGDYGTIYRSRDGGSSWQKISGVSTDVYLNSVTFGADGQHGWVTGDFGTILLSADGGESWQPVAAVPTYEDLSSAAFASDGLRGWVAGDFGTLLRTRDGGRSWQVSGGPPTEQALHCVAFLPDAQRGWVAGSNGTVLSTQDGGQTWRIVSGVAGGAELNSISFAEDGQHGCAVGASGALVFTVDAGQNWQKVAHPPSADALYAVALAPDGRRGWAVGGNGAILETHDSGQSWVKHSGVPAAAFLDSVFFGADGQHGWAVGGLGTILRTADGGQTWQKVPGVPTQQALRSVTFAAGCKRGWAVGDYSTIVRSEDGGQSWQWINGDSQTIGLTSIAFAADGERGWTVGTGGQVWRTVDGGAFWWMVGGAAKEGTLNSVTFSPDGQHGWAVGEHGTILRTSSAPEDFAGFDGTLSQQLEVAGGVIRPKFSFAGRTAPTDGLSVHLSLSGPNAKGDLAKGLARYFSFGQPFTGWKEQELGAGVYTGKVEVSDGWNVVLGQFQFGNGPWARFKSFMGWSGAPTEPLKFIEDYGTQNAVLLLALYCLGVIGLFVFLPSTFVLWHEKTAGLISALPISGKATDKVAQLAGLFLITRSRSLDAVVRRYAPLALAELERHPDASARRKWVAAPLQVEDELFGTAVRPFAEPAATVSGEFYIRGLTELKRHLVKPRWWLSIEGPGGVGKSALAFQLARWFAAPEPQSRLYLPQAIPISIRALEGGLDQEILAELKRILDLPRMSSQLSEALLNQRRVLAIVDGISEKSFDLDALELGALNPAKGAELIHLAVMTSRRRMQIADVVKVLPSPVDLGSIDAVLNRYLDDVIGAGRFNPSQREAIRDALKGIMKEMGGEEGKVPQIPMVFLKLIVQRADEVLGKDGPAAAPGRVEAALPKDLAELVDAYLASLLEARPDGVAEANQARRAALACIGLDGIPKWKPLASYESKSLTREQLESLVTTGLMTKDLSDIGDPRYKFALDPIAEYLAAKELVIALRDGKMSRAQLREASAQFVAGSDVASKVIQIARVLGVAVDGS